MKKISAYIFMAIAIICLIFILLMLCPWFNITQKTFVGLESLTEDKILSVIELDNKNSNLFAFNSIKAKKNLKKNPYIEDVTITKKLPNSIIINIKERKVRGYVPYLKNYLYIDDNGLVLDVQSSYTQPRPVVVGLDFKTFSLGNPLPVESTQTFNTIVELSKLMTKYQLIEDVVKVDVSNPEDIHLYINNINVYFGDFTNSNKKISLLNEIIKQIPKEDKGFLHLENPDESPRFEFLT